MSWSKLSDAIGSGTADPTIAASAMQPVPPPAVANKPAPGVKGPRGLAPRTSYTKVNTGAPPVPDAGASSQKSMSPRGMESLPTKVAHKESLMPTTMFQRPNLHDLVKEAMEGTASKIEAEAARQRGAVMPEQTKQASAEITPTEYVYKLASALDYMVKQAEEGTTSIQPGKGPNTLEVLEAQSSEKNIDAGEQGQATQQPPMNPPMQSSGVANDPSNAMQTNDDMMHGEQPVDPMGNEKAAMFMENLAALGVKIAEDPSLSRGETALALLTGGVPGYLGAGKARGAGGSALEGGLRGVGGYMAGAVPGSLVGSGLGALAGRAMGGAKGSAYEALGQMLGTTVGGLGGGVAGYKALTGKFNKPKDKAPAKDEKTAALLAANLEALGIKQAEDAISPASISAGSTQTGATPPEGASATGEAVPSEPSDVSSQKNLISSNEAAINYTKEQAKADPKKDLGKVLDEPALSASTDKTLQKNLDHTSEAGAKIASSHIRTAAAQAILSKLAAAQAPAKKKKTATLGGLDTPSGQSGFSAGQM